MIPTSCFPCAFEDRSGIATVVCAPAVVGLNLPDAAIALRAPRYSTGVNGRSLLRLTIK